MNFKTEKIGKLLEKNSYPGRGIILGVTPSGRQAVYAYFIMGRSENSRNRVFVKDDAGVTIYPFDESKVEDPSLIIYHPVRKTDKAWIVTNGDQTDTIVTALEVGGTFESALEHRCFEPDAPNYTPRISGILSLDGVFEYKLSILKSADRKGTECNRFTFSYAPIKGEGHFIHTYNGDGKPLPSFSGEPVRVAIEEDAEAFAKEIWENLNKDNKVALCVTYIDLADKSEQTIIINKNERYE